MQMKCTVGGCPDPVHVKSRGLCHRHYRRWHRYGDPLTQKHSSPDSTLEETLKFHGWIVTDLGCWEWRGPFNGKHGTLSFRGKKDYAYRASYAVWVGPIPDGLMVRHKCDNPPCINPDHLELGTHADNMADMWDRTPPVRHKGQDHARSKLTDEQVRKIRGLFSSGLRRHEIRDQFDVSWSTIDAIVKRRIWTHLD